MGRASASAAASAAAGEEADESSASARSERSRTAGAHGCARSADVHPPNSCRRRAVALPVACRVYTPIVSGQFRAPVAMFAAFEMKTSRSRPAFNI